MGATLYPLLCAIFLIVFNSQLEFSFDRESVKEDSHRENTQFSQKRIAGMIASVNVGLL